MKRIALLAIAVCAWAAAAEAKEYTAERFDVRAEVQRDGSLRVVETVVFRFENGTFTQVFREIPTGRTDGVEVSRASVDGHPVAFGKGPGEVEVADKKRVRVTWRFAPTSNTSRTFELTYVIRGVVRDTETADVLSWRVLPGQHAYRIESSTIEIAIPAALAVPPTVRKERVETATLEAGASRVRVYAGAIRKNGWIETTLQFPRGSVISGPPGWQQRRRTADQFAPRWIAAASVVLFAGLVLLAAMRQNYSSPPHDTSPVPASPALPDDLPPEIAGTLLANGSARFEHAMAALMSLAGRGVVAITEEPKGMFGQRNFVLERTAVTRALRPSEEVLLKLAFRDGDARVSLGKARSRVHSKFSRYSEALAAEMSAAGFRDSSRSQLRTRFNVVAVICLILAGAVAALTLPFISEYAAWPFLIAGAIALLALISSIAGASVTPLSDDAARRARYWRGFREHVKEVARDRATPTIDSSTLLAYAVALGLANDWAKYMKTHAAAVPPWFRALSAADASRAFVAFVATGGATAGHGASGGAAGGGASGAS